MVTLVDRAVGTMLRALEDAGVADNTIVVYSSEHGDQLGEHNIIQKAVFYEQSIRVPMLMRVPWLAGSETRVSGRYSHIDTVPTLLDLVGADLPGHLQGESRVPVLEGEATLEGNDVMIDWTGRDSKEPLCMQSVDHRILVSHDGWKLNLGEGDQGELYDLHGDPTESANLFDDPSQRERVRDMASPNPRLAASHRRHRAVAGGLALSTAPSLPAGSGPVRESGRITSLDLVRGVAVLGILLMNAVHFRFGSGPYFNLDAGGSETWLDWTVGIVGEVFIDQKFMGLFSLLFGAGMILFIDRASRRGARAVLLNLWRNSLLLLIGIFHYLLWEGDVLMAYAVSSLFLLALRKLPNRALISLGVALFAPVRRLCPHRAAHRRHDQTRLCPASGRRAMSRTKG